MKTVVVTRDYRNFVWWCRENDKKPTDPDLIALTDTDPRAEQRLRGIDRFKLVHVNGNPRIGVLQYLQYLRSEGRIIEDPVV